MFGSRNLQPKGTTIRNRGLAPNRVGLGDLVPRTDIRVFQARPHSKSTMIPALMRWRFRATGRVRKRPAYFTPAHELSSAKIWMKNTRKTVVLRKGAEAAKFEEERVFFACLASWRDKIFSPRIVKLLSATDTWQARCQLRQLHRVCGRDCNDGGILDIGIK